MIKKAAKRSMRTVPNKAPALNSAQVLHNKLNRLGAWELLLVKHGQETFLAQTMFVQDIEAYGARDQARPKRDARVGMLPPKLAQIIINLAIGDLGQKFIQQARLDGVQGAAEQRSKPCMKYGERAAEVATQQSAKSTSGAAGSASRQAGAARIVVLDPFCGTGVILQEALLMGYSAVGTDIDKRMVDYTKQNIRWLYEKHPEINGYVNVEAADATNHQWQMFSTVASETYLGRPLSRLPKPEVLEKIVQDVNTITKKFLANLAKQIKPKHIVALALPAWRVSKSEFKYLPVVDDLTDIGYNVKKFKHAQANQLIYYREEQIVTRQLVVLEKSKR